MLGSRSDASIVLGGPKQAAQTHPKEGDLQRCVESLQVIICDLLIENEKLRQHLIADKFLSFDTGHLCRKCGSFCKPKD